MRRFILSAIAVLWSAAASAQPGPGPGPAPNPWTVSGNSISYAGCVLVPATVSGGCQGSGTISSRVFTPPATTSGSGLTVLPGVAPSAPVNGAVWTTTSGMFVRINGVTIGPLGGATSSSFAGTSPITVSFPAGVVTYAFDLSVANTFTASQTASKATTTSPGWYAQLTGDTVPRVRVGLNATDIPSIAFGPGNAVRDAFIERVGAGSLRLGAPDAASPVAQTWGVQGVVAGTSNTAGAAFTIAGSRGTGSGNGGDLQISVALPSSSGSTQNALTGIMKVSGQTGALIWNTDNTYDIGATGATRPRDLWLGRNAAIAGTLNVTGHVTVEGVTSTGATGTGAFVFSNAPALVTPALGVATATTLAVAGCTIGANSFCATTGAFSSTLTSAAHTITSTASGAFTVGPAGATNPSLQVDASTASAATGLKIKSAAAAGGLALSVITSGTNENLTIDAAAAGTITFGGTSTGAITLARATTLSAALTYGGVTLSNTVTGTGSMVLATAPTMSAVTVTGSFTATGLVTNADLANASTTVNGTTCTLGSTCTITATATTITVGTTAVGSSADTRILRVNGSTLGDYTISGSGTVVAMATGPTITSATMVTPALGVATGTSLALNGCTIGSNAFCTTGSAAISSTLTSTAHTITSASATALAVGPSGTTNPSFQVDASTASAATGLKVKSAAAAGGLALSVITSGTNENLTIDAAAAGTITLGGTSTGAITLTRATTASAGLTVSTSFTATGLVTLPALATQNAYTLVGNFTGSSASPTASTIGALTSKPSPAAGDLVMLVDVSASNQIKQTTVSALASAGSVASIAGNTGAFTLSGLLTNSTNVLQVVAATQANQTTGTSNTLAVTPLHQQDHDSAAKAWVFFSTSGTINASYNVASVVKNSTGNYTVTWTLGFSSANYAADCTASTGQAPVTGRNASIITVLTFNVGGTATDSDTSCVAYGRQ